MVNNDSWFLTILLMASRLPPPSALRRNRLQLGTLRLPLLLPLPSFHLKIRAHFVTPSHRKNGNLENMGDTSSISWKELFHIFGGHLQKLG